MNDFYDLKINGINGTPIEFGGYRGQAVLIVNVASRCGYTPQYQGLEALYARYRDHGFSLLGVPCNQFGAQEPEGEAAILFFCQNRYGITFPLSCKIEVNGASRHPLYAWLLDPRRGFPGDLRWNFEKFLVNPKGCLVGRFSSDTDPAALEAEVIGVLPHAYRPPDRQRS